MHFLSLTLFTGQTEDLGLGRHKSTVVSGMMISVTLEVNVILCPGRQQQSYWKEKKENKRKNLIFFVAF